MDLPLFAHGVDLVAIERIEAMLRRHGEQFTRRCFTSIERAYAEAGSARRAERYAARFACKEAVFKALGTGWRDGMSWTDVGVVHEPSGRPRVELGGRCRTLAEDRGLERWYVSLSHAGPGRDGRGDAAPSGYAMASVIAIGGGGGRLARAARMP